MASDAFFPFEIISIKPPTVNVKYIIHPGGSVADKIVDEACKYYNIKVIKTSNSQNNKTNNKNEKFVLYWDIITIT